LGYEQVQLGPCCGGRHDKYQARRKVKQLRFQDKQQKKTAERYDRFNPLPFVTSKKKKTKIIHSDIQYLQIQRAENETVLNI